MENYNKQDILKAFLKDTTIINDHDNSQQEIASIVEYNSDSRDLAVIIKTNSSYQPLNAIYLDDDNKLHLSTRTVCGVIYNEPDNIIKFNDSVAFEGMKIKHVYFPNGVVQVVV